MVCLRVRAPLNTLGRSAVTIRSCCRTVSQDVTFALRQFRRSPGFAIAAIVTLALGIGATTAIFALVDGILVRRLPFPDRDRLVAINTLEFPGGALTTNPAAGDRGIEPLFCILREQPYYG